MMENIQKVDLTRIKPYGDTLNDGMVQMSFTLPVPYGDEANEAAKQLVEKMGFDDPAVVFSKDLGVGYTYFVIYGKCTHTVDYTSIEVPKVDMEFMDREEVMTFEK
jgi:beta-lysine 5,6-aminomutase beta subunit